METDKIQILKSLLWNITIGLWLYWLWTRRNLYRFSMKFPGFLGTPIFGALNKIKHTKYTLRAFGKMFEECKRQTICIWMGLYPVVLSADPDFIEKILSSSELLNKAKAIYLPLYKVLEGGIITSPESEWHHNRKMISPSFQHKVLLKFLPVFNKAKNTAIGKLDTMEDNVEHKLSEMLHRLSLSISMETTMGQPLSDGDPVAEDLSKNFSFLMEKTATQIFLSLLNLDGIFRFYNRFEKSKAYMHHFVSELIQQKLSSTQNNIGVATDSVDHVSNVASVECLKKPPNIFIDQAIQIYQKHQFSWRNIISESNTIVAASFETTANGIYSALVMLAMHPDVQERLYEEIVNVFPQKSFQMEYEHMQQLPYLDMVINETLRLAPSIPIIGRQAVKDTRICKELVLPRNIQIIISIFHLHRRTDIWGPNADKFNPDNFLPANMAGKHPYAYIPFSKGLRNCIGWRYALFAMKVIITGLIRNYRFTTSFKYEDLEFMENIALKYFNEPAFRIYHRE